jgi:hypothetical protein
VFEIAQQDGLEAESIGKRVFASDWASADNSSIRSIALSGLMAALLTWWNSRLDQFGRSGAGYRVQFGDFLAESGNLEAVEGPTK